MIYILASAVNVHFFKNNMIFGRTLHTVQKSVVKGLAVMYITVGQKIKKSPGQKNS